MSYLVLARKWRPQTFEQIRGQAHIVRALQNAISSERIAHAYLFSGIRGVGKTSAARVLAKALNCTSGPTATPCNDCDACREITDGKSPDVFEIDGASNTGVDDVRRLREAVRYPPVRGSYRIYIIDEVHMLSTAAFNALLKTLEEPPAHVVFVFATTDPRKLPVTILSRCQQFDFKRLAPRELTEILGDVARDEGISIDEKSLVALAREADGSVRDGQSLLDQVISYAGEKVAYDDVRDVLGVVDRGLVIDVARAVLERNPRAVMERIAEAEQFGYDVQRFACDLLDVFRDLAVLKAVEGGEDLVDLAAEEVEEVLRCAEDVPWEDVHARFDILARGLETLRVAVRPESVLEMTLLKMAKLPPLLSLSEIATRVRDRADTPTPANRPREAPPTARRDAPASGPTSPQRARAPGRAPTREIAETKPEDPGTAVAPVAEDEVGAPEGPPDAAPAGGPRDLGETWSELLAGAEEANRPFWNVLKAHAKLTSWDPEQRLATVTYDDPRHEFFLRSKTDLLTGVLRQVVAGDARLDLKCERPREQAEKRGETDRARSVKREALEHPLVREAVEIFDGNIDEVRVLKP
jgi:DNA polymerase-3 subunit gamma/tau